jgi:hypothetical protein
LWLPVVQHGVRTLGDRALNSHTLQSEITALLNEKAAHAEHLVAPSLYAFVPQCGQLDGGCWSKASKTHY